MGKPPAGIAFFDFDNTIMHGDIGPLFGNHLFRVRYERIKTEEGRAAADRDRRKLLAKFLPYLANLGIQAALYKTRALRRSQLVRTGYHALKGVEAAHYYGLMDEFVAEEIPDRIYPEMLVAMQEHHDAGRTCVVVTTGAEELVRRALRFLPDGVDLIGCRLEEKDGILTGKVDGPLYGADKANIVRAYCAAAGVDTANCWAYTDHYSDYHMLDEVGHGVCINPRGRLERLALEKEWDILRPDVPAGAA